MQSELRRPQRWRGRVQSPFAGWSVIVGVGIAVIFAVTFWASVWLLLRPSASLGTAVTYDLVEGDADAAVVADTDGTWAAASGETEAEDADAIAAREAEEDEAAELAAADHGVDLDSPAWHSVQDVPVVAVAETDYDTVAEAPLYGPFEPIYGPVMVAEGEANAVAQADPEAEQAARVEAMAQRAEEIAARAGDISEKAEQFAAKAEEFATRIEGLTARIDELEAKLQVSDGTSLRLAAVPSPTTRPNEAVARGNQTQTGTRAPWVITPQPGPGSRVAAGPLVLETAARGEAPISQLRLVLDGVNLPVAVERKDAKNWLGRTSTRVSAGSHTVAVSVVDAQGRTGSYRWQFSAGQ